MIGGLDEVAKEEEIQFSSSAKEYMYYDCVHLDKLFVAYNAL